MIELPERAARDFVVAHHYSASWPAARLRYGLVDQHAKTHHGGRIVGVAVLGVPMHPQVLRRPFPALRPYLESLELSRLVLLDEVPANGESWFVARVFRAAARAGIRGVVAYSDPVPRHRGSELVMPGHVGWVYQGTNARYLGRGTARRLTILPDGTVLTARSAAKVTAGDRGWRGVARRLVDLGAPPPPARTDLPAWLTAALARIGAATVRHPGNHRYAWALPGSSAVIEMPALPYPKSIDTSRSHP